VLWRKRVGEGYSAPSVADGKLILFHRVGDEEVVEALDPDTGESLWRIGYPTSYRDEYGWDNGPRTAPSIIDGVIYTYGAERVMQALDFETGVRLWMVDIRERFRTEKGPYGAGSTPLVAFGRVMINVGGADGAGIIALDAGTGEAVWTATDHGAGYSTPVLADIGGRTRAFFFTRRGLLDIDPEDGSVRSELHWRSISLASVNAASPVVVGQRLFVSATYGTGAAMLDVTDEGFSAVWSDDDTLSNHYAASIHHDGTLYGYHGRQPIVPALRAVDSETGQVLWDEDRFGAGSILRAGDTLVILRERGELVLADADREGYTPRASADILRPIVRAYPALAGGILYARNSDELVALDLRPR
jgi:outer membrane protein assembly factor BamB